MANIRISSAGDCPRRLLLEHKGAEGLPHWEGRTRAFEEGNIHEASILAWAAEFIPGGPWTLFDQQRTVKAAKNIPGHPDALATNDAEVVLFEAKALSKWAYQEFREKGVEVSHPQYRLQVQFYLHGLQKRRKHQIARAYLIVRNKETHKDRYWDHHWEEVAYDPAFCAKELERLQKLARLMDESGDIEPPYHPDTHWACAPKWCPFALHCHPVYEKPIMEIERKDGLADAVSRYMDLGDEIGALSAERELLKGVLQSNATDTPVLAGNYRFYMATGRRESFDTKLARKELAADVLARLLRVSEYKTLKIEEAM